MARTVAGTEAFALKRNTTFNEAKLAEALGTQTAVIAGGTVIKQDPPPGTMIPRGGGVTLTVARTRDFPVEIIEGADIRFERRKIGDIYDELKRVNPESVLKIFEDVEDYDALAPSQREEVDRALTQLGVGGAGGYKGAQGALALGAKG